MELTRKQVIKELEDYYSYVTGGGNINDFTEALDYAISSLKTDEAYQIMYECGEIFTKNEVIAMLTELKTEIDIMSDTVVEDRTTITIISWKGMQKRICKFIQSKIDKLKEKTDGNK